MGIFKNIIKKVALAAAVVAGKRILSKVVTDVIDGDKKTAPEAAAQPVKAKAASPRRRAPAKPKTASSAAAKSKPAPQAAGDAPKKPAKPRTRKPRAAKPKTTEAKKDGADGSATTVTGGSSTPANDSTGS